MVIVLLVLLELSTPQAVSGPCQCSALQASELRVNCTSQNLREVPHVPVDTMELHLHNNLLTSVPVGYFDTLHNLRMAKLSGNPFHCDCRIQYLSTWLLKNGALVPAMPTCASPHALAGKAITELDDSLFSSCGEGHSCSSVVYNAVLGFMLCALNVVLFWSLQLAKDSTYIMGIYEKHAGFEAASLRSRKPKHRGKKRRSSLALLNELERHVPNMEIFPQIIDTLHMKHNIKLKEI